MTPPASCTAACRRFQLGEHLALGRPDEPARAPRPAPSARDTVLSGRRRRLDRVGDPHRSARGGGGVGGADRGPARAAAGTRQPRAGGAAGQRAAGGTHRSDDPAGHLCGNPPRHRGSAAHLRRLGRTRHGPGLAHRRPWRRKRRHRRSADRLSRTAPGKRRGLARSGGGGGTRVAAGPVREAASPCRSPASPRSSAGSAPPAWWRRPAGSFRASTASMPAGPFRRCRASRPPSSTGSPTPSTPSPRAWPEPRPSAPRCCSGWSKCRRRSGRPSPATCTMPSANASPRQARSPPPSKRACRRIARTCAPMPPASRAVVASMRGSLRGALAQLELPDLAGIGLGEGLRGLVSDWQACLRAGPRLHLDVAGDLTGPVGAGLREPLSDRAGAPDQRPAARAAEPGLPAAAANRSRGSPDHADRPRRRRRRCRARRQRGGPRPRRDPSAARRARRRPVPHRTWQRHLCLRHRSSPGLRRAMPTLLLVDDHPVVREGYRRLLERQPGFTVAAEAGDGGGGLPPLQGGGAGPRHPRPVAAGAERHRGDPAYPAMGRRRPHPRVQHAHRRCRRAPSLRCGCQWLCQQGERAAGPPDSGSGRPARGARP
jgi:hypothetical protein